MLQIKFGKFGIPGEINVTKKAVCILQTALK